MRVPQTRIMRGNSAPFTAPFPECMWISEFLPMIWDWSACIKEVAALTTTVWVGCQFNFRRLADLTQEKVGSLV